MRIGITQFDGLCFLTEQGEKRITLAVVDVNTLQGLTCLTRGRDRGAQNRGCRTLEVGARQKHGRIFAAEFEVRRNEGLCGGPGNLAAGGYAASECDDIDALDQVSTGLTVAGDKPQNRL